MSITYLEKTGVFVATDTAAWRVRDLIAEMGSSYRVRRACVTSDWVANPDQPGSFRTQCLSEVEDFIDHCDAVARQEFDRRTQVQTQRAFDERITRVVLQDGLYLASGGAWGCDLLVQCGWTWQLVGQVQQLACDDTALVDDAEIPDEVLDDTALKKLTAWRLKRDQKEAARLARKALKENMVIDLSADGQQFVASNSYHQQHELRSRGWHYDSTQRAWTLAATSDQPESLYYATFPLLQFMRPQAASRAQAIADTVAQAIAASSAKDADTAMAAPPGLSYLAFQRAGIAYLLAHRDALLADEMGLGKTIQAIGVANADPEVDCVLVVCPASLKLNWVREFDKWGTRGWSAVAAGNKKQDHLLASAPVVVINYDLLDKYRSVLAQRQWGLLVLDEAHYLKNKKTKRAASVFGVSRSTAMARMFKKYIPEELRMSLYLWSDKENYLRVQMARDPAIEVELQGMIEPGLVGKRRIFITGTPIPNRPIELFPILQQIVPEGLGANYQKYAEKYCAARWHYGRLKVDGASNLEELQTRLRASCMVRRLKKDVLPELPPKFHQLVELEASGPLARLSDRENQLDMRHHESIQALRARMAASADATSARYRAAVAELREAEAIHFSEMGKIRHELAIAKIPGIIAHIHTMLDEGCQKLVVMAHHHDVFEALHKTFETAALVTGATPGEQRQAQVDRFQTDAQCKLFIGSIEAAGVGLTLTATSTILFAEQDWSPGKMQQAEDRCHRIGQGESVLIQTLVVDGSLDAKLSKTLATKAAVAQLALDVAPQQPVQVAPLSAPDRPWTPGAAELAHAQGSGAIGTHGVPVVATPELSPQRRAAIHQCLQLLAAKDPDRAREVNGIGFNQLDGPRGHELAGLQNLSQEQAAVGLALMAKYRRQLPAELFLLATDLAPTADLQDGLAARQRSAPKNNKGTTRRAAMRLPGASQGADAAKAAPAPRQRGRPKVYVDQPAPTTSERSTKSLQALAAAGGKRIMLRLSPQAYQALRSIMAKAGVTEETRAINQVLLDFQRDLPSMPTPNT